MVLHVQIVPFVDVCQLLLYMGRLIGVCVGRWGVYGIM